MADTKTVTAPGNVNIEIPIPDFEIKCCVGEGAFGQVFLALSKATGRFRAIKVVRRSRFASDRPYDIEFAGLKRFEEVSREHEGFVDILHVTRDDHAGYFSYVMEIADDLESAQQIDPARYVPRTLAKMLERQRRLPTSESIRVGLALTAALGELHRRNLVHRDINPRNIVFVRGAPKLADVGLVTEANLQSHTLIGTPDYMDPPVHGTPGGDLYGFGKVLYTMATGLHARHCPTPPTDLDNNPDGPVLRELEAIWRRACQEDRQNRYSDAAEIHKELLALQAGASVLRLKRFERAVELVRRYGLAVLILLASLGVGLYFRAEQQAQAAELRQRRVGTFVANGNHSLDSADLLGALSWFAEAWRLDSRRENDLLHRIRLESVLERAPALKRIWFHDRQVKEAYFPGQENQVVMSDSSGQWRVYDLSSGQPLLKPFGLGLPNERISLSTRTGIAVTAAETDRIWLWDYERGNKIREVRRPGKSISYASISPDGQWVAAAESSTNGVEALLLWKNSDEFEDPIVLSRDLRGTHCLRFSPDSQLLLSCGVITPPQVWDVAARRLVSTFTNHLDSVFNGAFSPDSLQIATASFDRTARIWDARAGKEIARFLHNDGVWAAEFNSDGTLLATAGLDFTARIWDPALPASPQLLRHNSKVLRAEFSPQDRLLLTSCYDNTVRVWYLPKLPKASFANGLVLDGGARSILFTNGIWSVCDRSGTVRGTLDITNQPGAQFWFAPDDRVFAATCPADADPSADLRVQVFDAQTAKPLRQSIPVPGRWNNLTVSPGGRWFAAFDDQSGAVWDTLSGQRVHSISNGCRRAAFSPDASLLAVGQANVVSVLGMGSDFAKVADWTHPTNSQISSIAWDTTSKRLITSCWNNTFTPLESQVWAARTGEALGPRLEHQDGVLYATFSHNGKRAITCGEDFTAVLWDLTTGRQMAALRHRDQVFYAAFSENDRLVATAAADDAVAVWSAETGEPLTSLTVPLTRPGRLPSIRFTDDNRALLICDPGRKQSLFWKLPYYNRPLQDLLLTVRLRSAQEPDSTETLIPQSKEALRTMWELLRSKYPSDFALPTE